MDQAAHNISSIKIESLIEIKNRVSITKDSDIPKLPGIYLLTCIINNKIYVGESLDLYERMAEHRRSETSLKETKRPIIRAIRKYKWANFIIKILVCFSRENITKLDLVNIEERYILLFNSTNSNIGYNVLKRSGVPGLISQTEEFKSRLSQLMSGDNNPFYGRKHTANSKQIISETHIGKKLTEEHKINLSLSHKGKQCGENHPMWGKKHSEETRSKISSMVKGKKHSKEHILKRFMNIKKPVDQFDLETGILIKRWDCAADAARFLSCKAGLASSIRQVCTGQRTSVYGFGWKYV